MSVEYRMWLSARFAYDRALRCFLNGDLGAREEVERLGVLLGESFDVFVGTLPGRGELAHDAP